MLLDDCKDHKHSVNCKNILAIKEPLNLIKSQLAVYRECRVGEQKQPGFFIK